MKFVWGHGLTSSMAAEDDARIFAWTMPEGWEHVRYDAPGHGTAAPPTSPADAEWQALAQRMLEVADEAGANEFVAGGASMGAATALHAAVLAPERVRGLVLVIPPTAWDSRPAQAELYEMSASYLDAKGIEAWVEAASKVPRNPPWATWPERWERLRTADPVALANVFRGAGMSDLPPLSDLADVDVPTLILAWADDPGHPLSTAEWLAITMPRSAYVIARSVKEVLEWKGEVRRFLSRLGS